MGYNMGKAKTAYSSFPHKSTIYDRRDSHFYVSGKLL